jgi:hypothetical protein
MIGRLVFHPDIAAPDIEDHVAVTDAGNMLGVNPEAKTLQ